MLRLNVEIKCLDQIIVLPMIDKIKPPVGGFIFYRVSLIQTLA
ncbi:MAG: hypothetical protein ACJAT8_000684 [Cellvibrionaceae bacterium]|jgi:hypothetical protein